jgi:hypothetical protein
MNNDVKVARELLAVAKMVMASQGTSQSQHHVEVKLDGGASTAKSIKIPDDVWENTVERNEFARKYFKSLGYNKVAIIRWS